MATLLEHIDAFIAKHGLSESQFGLLALNNLIVVADMLVLPTVDLSVPRLIAALAAVSVLIYAFVWELD